LLAYAIAPGRRRRAGTRHLRKKNMIHTKPNTNTNEKASSDNAATKLADPVASKIAQSDDKLTKVETPAATTDTPKK
jgi:hypothetical protein